MILLFALLLAPPPPAQLPVLWDASVTAGGTEVPFRFEVTLNDGRVSGAFFNGEERIRSTAGSWRDNELTLEFPQYAGRVEAKWDGARLTGTYFRSGRAPLPLSAVPHRPPPPEKNVPSIAGQWEIELKSARGEAAWKFFVRQSGPEVSASILRIDGDTGALTGSYRDGKFILSHFSGARPSVFVVILQPDGTLSVTQNGKNTYIAVKSSEARAKGLPEPADPSRWTSVADPSQPLRFRFPDLNGTMVSESDERFRGKVVLLNITGSWCPNCHDEAPFLVDLYRAYHAQGLEIVALAFEEEEQLKDPVRLRTFIGTYGIPYTVLLAGDPSELQARLPQAVNLNTFPATFFVGRDGLVHGAHAGFAGKATGEEHARQTVEMRRKVEDLLAETGINR